MKKTMLYMMIPFALIGIGFATVPTFLPGNTPSVKMDVSQKINLALRQTAHRLLQQAGDSTSRIAPIKKTAENIYLVELEYPFSYDSLPVFLQNSFVEHGVQDKYEVAVWDYTVKELLLGYTSLDVSSAKGVPCQGRNQAGKYLNFSVTFAETPSVLSKNNLIWFVFGGFCFLGLVTSAYFLFLNAKKNKEIPISNSFQADETPVSNTLSTDETHLIYIGKSIFDTHHQTFTTEGNTQKLTFQESKLLQLFCTHQNELLERDFILKSVWADDGVLVTRTVDVFISRLRKIMKDDAALKIVNVHSRGYRFETVF